MTSLAPSHAAVDACVCGPRPIITVFVVFDPSSAHMKF
jgi:hypothetical protein